MFYLTKEFRFEAAHQLMHHDGKCARLHGHSWVARVQFAAPTLIASGPKEGMVVDYGDIGALIRPIVDNYLDHYFLNETLGTQVPTSEFIATWLYHTIEARLAGLPVAAVNFAGAKLHSVTICETCTSECTYAPTEGLGV
jgi:6-pyruvoyltetrahydropterin/6-carboxytetrahydropterin synthase